MLELFPLTVLCGIRGLEMFWRVVTPVGLSAIQVLELLRPTDSRMQRGDVRTSEILSRTVSRHDAESEPAGTHLRRVLEGMLRRSDSAPSVHVAGDKLQQADASRRQPSLRGPTSSQPARTERRGRAVLPGQRGGV